MVHKQLRVTVSLELYRALKAVRDRYKDKSISVTVRHMLADSLEEPELSKMPGPGRPRSRT